MMKKRLTSLALSAMMVLSMVPATAFAAKDAGTPPTYNSATGCYEISTPAQLLYLAGKWKDGAPRDGHYVLTADIDGKLNPQDNATRAEVAAILMRFCEMSK